MVLVEARPRTRAASARREHLQLVAAADADVRHGARRLAAVDCRALGPLVFVWLVPWLTVVPPWLPIASGYEAYCPSACHGTCWVSWKYC
jgi:hypothetical protein